MHVVRVFNVFDLFDDATDISELLLRRLSDILAYQYDHVLLYSITDSQTECLLIP